MGSWPRKKIRCSWFIESGLIEEFCMRDSMKKWLRASWMLIEAWRFGVLFRIRRYILKNIWLIQD